MADIKDSKNSLLVDSSSHTENPLPAYDTAIHTPSSRFYFNNVPKKVGSARNIDINLCRMNIDGQPSADAVEKAFHVAFVDQGFTIHRGTNDVAPVVATANFRKKHPVGADIWIPGTSTLRIVASDLKVSKKKKKSLPTTEDERHLLPVCGSTPPVNWDILQEPQSSNGENSNGATSSSRKPYKVLNANMDLVDENDVVHATFNNQYDRNQKSDNLAKREEWGYLDVFATAETADQPFVDQMIVSLVTLLELNMWMRTQGNKDNALGLGIFSVFLCTVM